MELKKNPLMALLVGLCSLTGVSFAGSALASVVEYTSQNSFDAANPTAITYGFDAGGEINFMPNPSTFNGVTFTDDTTAGDIANSQIPLLVLADSGDTPTYGVDFLSFQNQNTGIEAVISPTGTNFFGFNFGSYLPIDGDYVTLTLNTGNEYLILPTSTESFIGFSSSTPITSITIDYPNGYAFDVTSYSTVAAAPEPAAWLMMVIGIGMAGAALRRRTHRNGDEVRLRAVVGAWAF